MKNLTDVDALRIPQGTIISTTRRPSSPQLRQTGRFLKGPIPWPWLVRAMSLRGHALHVGIRLWFEAGLVRSDNVSISMTGMAPMGVTRYAASRGLTALEGAGLVSAVRHAGRKAVVTILPTSAVTNPAVLEAGEAVEREDVVPSQGKKGGDEERRLPLGDPAPYGK